MTSITYDDVRNSKHPILVEENGTHVLIVDDRIYKKLSDKEKDAYRDEIRKHILHVIDLNKDKPELLSEKTASWLKSVFSSADLKDFDPLIRDENGVAALYQSHFSNFFLLSLQDSQAWIMTYHLRNKEKTPENFLEVNDKNTFHHELAHALYGVKEPGADYMAAVGTLIENPASRGGLQIIGDFRTVGGFQGRFDDGDTHTNATEIAAGMAINAVLAMPQEELNRLGALTPEERRMSLFNVAKEFDSLVHGYGPLAMQNRLNKDLEKRRDQLTALGEWHDAASVAKNLLEKNCPYPRDSVIYKLLETYAAARKRQLENNYRELYPNPKETSELQKEWQSAINFAPEKKEPEAITSPAPVTPFKPR